MNRCRSGFYTSDFEIDWLLETSLGDCNHHRVHCAVNMTNLNATADDLGSGTNGSDANDSAAIAWDDLDDVPCDRGLMCQSIAGDFLCVGVASVDPLESASSSDVPDEIAVTVWVGIGSAILIVAALVVALVKWKSYRSRQAKVMPNHIMELGTAAAVLSHHKIMVQASSEKVPHNDTGSPVPKTVRGARFNCKSMPRRQTFAKKVPFPVDAFNIPPQIQTPKISLEKRKFPEAPRPGSKTPE